MKIEKINDNQIRCTLTGADLEQRQIKLSELAYGTPKAQALFREMLRWAAYKFGFDVDGMPVMVEAIPMSADTLVLIVTKVPYPDELDPRFSRFTEGDGSWADYDDLYDDEELFTDEELDELFGGGMRPSMPKLSYNGAADELVRTYEHTDNAEDEKTADGEEAPANQPQNITKIYTFQNLEEILPLSHIAGDLYHGQNALLKDHNGRYHLILHKDDTALADFNRLTNILAEYALPEGDAQGTEDYLVENYKTILAKDALATLAEI